MVDVQAEQERLTAELEGAYASLTQSGEQARKLRARADAAYRQRDKAVAVLAECAKADLPSDLLRKVGDALAPEEDEDG
jgi:chaperonin cofactor prefoldin